MSLTIARIGKNETVKFAVDELMRLLRAMDETLFIDKRVYNERDPEKNAVIWVGLDGSVKESKQDDEIFIDIQNGCGIISGSNPRSVLMAVYRFMFSLGCRFLRPGKAGEKIPKKRLSAEELNVTIRDRASYRHRSMCIEGRVSYEHIYNMIDWLPKVGMNGYFMQFQVPGIFFRRFYNQKNPYFDKIDVDDSDIEHIWCSLEEEIIKRGLNYHATGHGWTCIPFGLPGTGWDKFEGEVPENTKQYLAMLDGERRLTHNTLDTNICYSNKNARDIMNDAIVEYCKAHPAVNYLHFWLADGKNNHCECPECSKLRPSDYYVMMLNELDEKLTAAGVDTKIVCLIYLDLLWEPEVEKIKNQDRFVLMFAPITRTYTNAFSDFDRSEKVELSSYVRNKLTMPTSVAENVARLNKWQTEQLQGDSFDFDYHLMWDHYTDPGYYECSRILHKDMTGLDVIGLNGMVSCQTNRAAFPTGLPMYAMAKGLWDKASQFTDITAEYFTAAFGEDAAIVEEYLKTLSRLFCPPYLRGEKPVSAEEMVAQVYEAKRVIDIFETQHIKEKAEISADWKHLMYHAEICRKYADVIIAYISKDEKGMEETKTALCEYNKLTEPELHEYFDIGTFDRIWGKYIINL